MAKYRMYVDEVGNPGLGPSTVDKNRYLSLTGVILSLDYVRETLHPRLEDLKRRYFGEHPDDPITLHRKELVNQAPPFAALRDVALREAFNVELMELIETLDYVVITSVIDKREHLEKYPVWLADPYHYCLTVILERYVLWLHGKGAKGDVMAESRGGGEDRRLKNEFERIYRTSAAVGNNRFAERLTSSQLKVKPKSANIAGLQLADMIAHPSFITTKARHEGQPQADNFGGRIAAVLEASKYRRRWDGQIEGWGRKWLP
jgi:Protein of unknown function (DUF3800)